MLRQPIGESGRTATFVVAASDALDKTKAQADYVCDGAADEVPINLAIAAIPAGGGRVVLSEGQFNVDDRLVFKSGIHLVGNGGTIVLSKKDFWCEPDGIAYVTLEDLKFDGNRVTIGALDNGLTESSNGWFLDVTLLKVLNCEFRHFSGTPIAVNEGAKVITRGCVFEDILGHTDYGGVSAYGSGGVYMRDVDEGLVVGNAFDTIDDNAVGISGSGVSVIGNTMRECRFMAAINDSPLREMTYAILDGNRGSRLYRGVLLGFSAGVKLARNVIIANNRIKTDIAVTRWTDVHATTLFDALVFQEDVINVQIVGNNIDAAARALYQSAVSDLQGVSIRDNYIVHTVSNNVNLGTNQGVIANNTIVTNGINGSQRPLNTTDLTVLNNVMEINTGQVALIAGGSIVIRNNVGFATENSGTGSIASGTTTDVITHGLDVTPTVDDISIILAENPTNTPGAIWVDTVGATEFTVNCENDPGISNLDFGWRAQVL